MTDLKHAFRSLRKTPGFTLVALLTLALGIGANTAVFSLVQAVLLRPFPYPDPERLVVLWENLIRFDKASIAWPDLQDWQKQNRTFAAIGGFRRHNYTLTGRGPAERVQGAQVSAAFFAAIGLPPQSGRVFRDEEDRPGTAPLAVLTHAFWKNRFGGDPAVVGRTLVLDGEPFTVIGIMPAEFSHPFGTDFLTQLGRFGNTENWQARDNHPGIYAIGRLKPGVTLEQGFADLKRVSAAISLAHPGQSTGVVAAGQPLFENAVGAYRGGLIVLLGAVALVLLIACANLANLLLARSTAREAEFSVRAALGATRVRLVRQLLVENLVLSLGGAALGVLLAAWARNGIVALSPVGPARFQETAVDARVLAVTAVLAVLTALVFGLWPAWKSAQPDLRASLQAGGGRTGSDGPRTARARELLIVAEIALTLVLLVGAGLLLRSFARMQRADLGFDSHQVLTAQITLPEKSHPKDEDVLQFNRRVLERIAALPGVKQADLATHSPLNTGWQTTYVIPGRPKPAPGQFPFAEMNVISDTYFQTLNIPLVRGRAFGPEDNAQSPPTVIIDQAFADRAWPGADPIGQRVGLGGSEENAAVVIGVVPTLKVYGYGQEPTLVQAYISARRNPPRAFMLLVRTTLDAPALTAALRRAVSEVDPNQALWDIRTLDSRIDDTFVNARLYAFLLTIFAGLALLLASIGLYGVLAYQVGRRTREFGIRLALGAVQSQLIGLVLRRGLRLLGIGLALGLLGSLALGRVLRSLLYRTSALDPLVFSGVAVLLALVALLACWLPARRATRVNPIEALRTE